MILLSLEERRAHNIIIILSETRHDNYNTHTITQISAYVCTVNLFNIECKWRNNNNNNNK